MPEEVHHTETHNVRWVGSLAQCDYCKQWFHNEADAEEAERGRDEGDDDVDAEAVAADDHEIPRGRPRARGHGEGSEAGMMAHQRRQ